MSQVKRNLLANLVSGAWLPLVALASMPFYIRMMGMESFGLIGVFQIVTAMCVPLDLGLSTTLNRELARLSVLPDARQEMRNLLRTLEWVYVGMAVLIGVTVAAGSSLAAEYWLNPKELTQVQTAAAVALMGPALAAQWPMLLYAGGMLGLGRQVSLAGVNMVMYAIRFGGVVPVLWLVQPSIHVFFLWQFVTAVIHTLWVRALLVRALPAPPQRAKAQWGLIHAHRYFAAGSTGIGISGLALSQVDKVILNKMVSLEVFGYYSLATTLASTLSRAAGPLSTTLFPQFTQLYQKKEWAQMATLYHRGCQLLSVLVFPVAGVLILFSRQILEILQPWTKLPALADNTTVVLALLAGAMAANALQSVPYAVQLSHGWTKPTFFTNMIVAVLLAPAVALFTTWWGPAGAALACLGANVLCLNIYMPWMYRRILTAERTRWLVQDVVWPLAAAAAAVGVVRLVTPAHLGMQWSIVALMAATAVSLLACAMAAPVSRGWLAAVVKRRSE